mmetsp:Transcript_2274/g.4069  ORF Transcript_2274/g.4069 Transcript_2274/m.4069 type:complete len:137 (-) Transcript_2274:163-573(-)
MSQVCYCFDEDTIIDGWTPCASKEYQMKSLSCDHKFVPQISLFDGIIGIQDGILNETSIIVVFIPSTMTSVFQSQNDLGDLFHSSSNPVLKSVADSFDGSNCKLFSDYQQLPRIGGSEESPFENSSTALHLTLGTM